MAASILLMAGALLSTLVISHLASSVSSVNQSVTSWALAIGLIGATLSLIHGGYDLANQIHPPATDLLGDAGYPNPVDPRGLATFGLLGLSFLILTTLAARSDRYSAGLARLGQALGVIMVVIYLGRLIILDPAHPVVRVALAAGVAANTIFLSLLGRSWLREGN
jgi:hypothetical protein